MALKSCEDEKSKTNGLWYIPLRQQVEDTEFIIHNDTTHAANSAYHTSTMEETIKFLHQCLFSSSVDTLCKALDNDQLIGFPHMTSKLVRKYLPASTATAKGHMNRQRKGIRSTSKQTDEIIEEDFQPKIDENAEIELFIGATIAEQNEGTIYTDQKGNFPVTSYHGKRAHFVAYDTGAMP